ncbi:hypothetical protein [Streptomyces sp. NPDC057877]|uniref:hypothetical protein n=1 Tax=Streptomyces sp. NPDC057877 TaxID=3346269 RepID=UPI00368CF939
MQAPWYRQKVKVPRRVWEGGRYSPGAVAYHAQITALAQRADGCRAAVATLAGYLGDSKRTAERYLAELAAPGPDGIPELATVRRTGADGDGETAERRTRGCTRGEHFAYVPVAAAKTLRHPVFVLYCALAHATATRTPVTTGELAALLDVTERTARRMTAELERLGWITVHRRTGRHGRHDYEVHERPLHPVDDPTGADTDGGSGACTDGGSLAIKEDAGLTDERSTQERGSFRRRRGTGSTPADPVDTPGNSAGGNYPVAPVIPAAFQGRVRPSARPAYDGPPLTLSPRVWAVLAPVHDLLPAISPYLVRRIAREIGRQLDTGVWAEDIRDQLTRLRTWTPPAEIRDPGRWILGAALPVRPGPCGTADCHYGFQRYTGTPCKACADTAERALGAHPPHTATWHECTTCQAPSRTPLTGHQCATCRTA